MSANKARTSVHIFFSKLLYFKFDQVYTKTICTLFLLHCSRLSLQEKKTSETQAADIIFANKKLAYLQQTLCFVALVDNNMHCLPDAKKQATLKAKTLYLQTKQMENLPILKCHSILTT